MWDGMNKLQGELILDERALKFQLNDFAESELPMNLPLSEIEQANQLISFVGEVGGKGIALAESEGFFTT